jgi:hypothetical protein
MSSLNQGQDPSKDGVSGMRLLEWLRTQIAWYSPFGPSAPGHRKMVRLAKQFLQREHCSHAGLHSVRPVRNESVLDIFASRLGQNQPVGTLWEIFFRPDENSHHIGKSSGLIIVLIDSGTNHCAFQDGH